MINGLTLTLGERTPVTLNKEISLICDLCKWPAKNYADFLEASKEGWVHVGQESYYDDRSFFDSHVCPSYMKKIDAQKLKARSE